MNERTNIATVGAALLVVIALGLMILQPLSSSVTVAHIAGFGLFHTTSVATELAATSAPSSADEQNKAARSSITHEQALWFADTLDDVSAEDSFEQTNTAPQTLQLTAVRRFSQFDRAHFAINCVLLNDTTPSLQDQISAPLQSFWYPHYGANLAQAPPITSC